MAEQMITFVADIKLSDDDIREADDFIEQAIQNRIGHTGAAVIEVIPELITELRERTKR